MHVSFHLAQEVAAA